jgi:hypothetical protein
LTVLIAFAASSCSLGERTEYASRLVASPERAAAAGTAVGTMSFELAVKPAGDDTPAVAGQAPGAGANVTPPPAGDLPIVVDFTHKTASIAMAAPGGAPEPVVVLDGTRIFVRRGSTGGISSRRWVVLDVGRLEEVSRPDGTDLAERTGLLMVAFPGPLQLLELLAGSLTGSAKQAGPNTYAANVSREKADRELGLDDDDIEYRSNVLRLVAVVDEVHPAKVTLDTDGRPTSVDVRLHPRLRRDLDVALRVRTQLTYQPARVEIPSPDDTLKLETVGQLLGELVGLGQALSGQKADEAA